MTLLLGDKGSHRARALNESGIVANKSPYRNSVREDHGCY